MLAADPDTTMTAVAQVIAKDPAMSARVVSMANSAYYRRAIEIDSVNAGVLRLGLDGVRNTVILPRIRAKLERDPFSESLWRHACGVGATAQFVARRAKMSAETAYLAGLLHDMGEVLLTRWSLPEIIVFSAGWHHNPPPVADTPSERMAHVVGLADSLVEAFEASAELDPHALQSAEALGIEEAQVNEVWELVPEIVSQSTQ